MAFQVKRYHDFSCGHRVVGHEGHCRHLHGHNYRVHFICEADSQHSQLDDIGRVIDFGEIKSRLCMWLEENWDHKFLAWDEDTLIESLFVESQHILNDEDSRTFRESIVPVPFNPTAENLAKYLVTEVGPEQLQGTGIKLVEVIIEETVKCHASFKVDL